MSTKNRDTAPPLPHSITTPRLTLRKPVPSDAPLIFTAYAQDPEVTRFLRFRPHTAVAESEEHIERVLQKWATGLELSWFLVTHADEQLIGSIAARIKPDEVELGYLVARPNWGQGFGLEAVNAVTAWAFTLPTIQRVIAFCDVENHASARLLEKAGFSRLGVREQCSLHPNISDLPRDCYEYHRSRP